MSTAIDWFRKPGIRGQDDPGTLNACYNALDRHVIRGRAEAVAAVLDDREWTYAELLTEVGAFAGALRAFGVGVGDRVIVGPLSGSHEVIAGLAVARLGAIRAYAPASAGTVAAPLESAGPRVAVLPTAPEVELGETPLITVDDSSELSWETVMRAGRTDPAGCADVTPDSILADLDGRSVTVLDALVDRSTAPEGACVIDIGGVPQWVHT